MNGASVKRNNHYQSSANRASLKHERQDLNSDLPPLSQPRANNNTKKSDELLALGASAKFGYTQRNRLRIRGCQYVIWNWTRVLGQHQYEKLHVQFLIYRNPLILKRQVGLLIPSKYNMQPLCYQESNTGPQSEQETAQPTYHRETIVLNIQFTVNTRQYYCWLLLDRTFSCCDWLTMVVTYTRLDLRP